MCRNPGWKVTFNDEFDGSSLNKANWVAYNNVTHGPTEKQLYLAKNVRVENGNLVIQTIKDAVHDSDGILYNFSSGWVESQHLQYQAYGRFEVRAKLPPPAVGAVGKWPVAWPAHWLMPESNICWPKGGEIDIMEAYRPTPSGKGSVLMTYHWASTCGNDQWDKLFGKFPDTINTTVVDWADEYHTFGIEWRNDTIDWFVDGLLKYSRIAGSPSSLFIPSEPFYMILNTAMQPWGNASVDTGLPTEHLIDRVTWCLPTEEAGELQSTTKAVDLSL
eukprot:gene7975-24287_t